MTAKICLISPDQLSANPALVGQRLFIINVFASFARILLGAQEILHISELKNLLPSRSCERSVVNSVFVSS